MSYRFRAYCDICNESSDWYGREGLASAWRDLHFEKEHLSNPMKKENCRIQRDTVEVVE